MHFEFVGLDVVSNQQCELVNCASENFSNVLDGSSKVLQHCRQQPLVWQLMPQMTESLNFTLGAYTDTFFIGVLFLGIVCSWFAICFGMI